MIRDIEFQKFVVIEKVKYSHRQDYGIKLLSVTESIDEAKELVQKLRQSYKQNEHNQINFLYLQIDNDLLQERLGNNQRKDTTS